MRVVINDFAGHPFQIQLSRELARRGHQVIHTFARGVPGPKGAVEPRRGDPTCLTIRPIGVGSAVKKYSLFSRAQAHWRYAREVVSLVVRSGADVVLSGNTPLDAQRRIQVACNRNGVSFVHWIQDVYCEALRTFLRRRFGPAGSLLARPFYFLERTVCQEATSVIMIAPHFERELAQLGIRPRRCRVIPNWAPLDELPVRPKANPWSVALQLHDKTVFLYTGTLGMKHSPHLILALARELRKVPMARLVLASEGMGRDYIERARDHTVNETIVTLPIQPYESLPDVLAAGDVLLAAIDSGASRFAVPSKVLTYLCAGRPVLLAAPEDNLAATIVKQANAGFVVAPDNAGEFVKAALLLCDNAGLRQQLGLNARRYAVAHFDISSIADRFEQALTEARLQCPA